MGSISYQIPDGSSAKKEVLKYARDNFKGELLVHNFGPGDYGGMKYGGWGGYFYGAHKHPDGYVYASVIAFGQYQGDVCIKAMDESMGPGADGASVKVLKALSPLREDDGLGNEWAKEWRERAWAYHEKKAAAKAAIGKLIKLDNPVNLSDGSSVQYVEVVDMKLWRKPFGGFIRAGSDWFLRGWEVASEIKEEVNA